MIRLSSKFRCSGLSSKKPPAFSTGGWKRHYWVLPETPSYNKKGRLQKGKGKQTTTTTTTKKRNAVSATFASSSVAQRKRRSTVQPHKNALTRAVRRPEKKKNRFQCAFLAPSFSTTCSDACFLPPTWQNPLKQRDLVIYLSSFSIRPFLFHCILRSTLKRKEKSWKGGKKHLVEGAQLKRRRPKTTTTEKNT